MKIFQVIFSKDRNFRRQAKIKIASFDAITARTKAFRQLKTSYPEVTILSVNPVF